MSFEKNSGLLAPSQLWSHLLSHWLSSTGRFLPSKSPKDYTPHAFHFPGLPKSHFFLEASTDMPHGALPCLNFSGFLQNLPLVLVGTCVGLSFPEQLAHGLWSLEGFETWSYHLLAVCSCASYLNSQSLLSFLICKVGISIMVSTS